MNMQTTITEQAITTALAEFALGLGHDDVPAEVRTRAHHTMLDAAGIAVASTR